VLFNMESVLSDIGRKEHSLRRLHMRGRPATASCLARWGLTCANVANNHILEQGRACAIDTVRHLQEAGLQTVGGGRDGLFEPGLQVVDLEIKDQKLSILGLCLLDEKYAYAGGRDIGPVMEEVRSRSRSGRTVIVSLHWGKELMDRPTAAQKRWAEDLLAAGATVIAGHHPHVVQGVELKQGRLVAYSLGNFIFDSFLEDCCWSMALTIELADRQVRAWDFVPVFKDEEHRPMFAAGPEKARLEAEIRRRCALLAEPTDPEQEQQRYLSDFVRTDRAARRALRRRLLTTLSRKRLVFWPQLFLRPVQRRLGRW
jgi:poly-gamma-glutamate synthesis protein (capsule biosynthesis protein)